MSLASEAANETGKQRVTEPNVFPVVTRLAADLHTPASAFLRLAAGENWSFLFESVERGESVGRYSFLGACPHNIFRGRGDNTSITDENGGERVVAATVVEVLREHFSRYRLTADPSLPPFTGGAVGYLSYESARWFEPALKFRHANAQDDALIMLYRTVAAFDHVLQQIVLVTLVFADETDGSAAALEIALKDAEQVNAELARRLEAPLPTLRLTAVRSAPITPLPAKSSWERASFERAVQRIQEYIAAGDCYQAVLSQEFETRVTAQPFDIYRALRATNPSPYMFFLGTPAESLIGSSPEMLVRCFGDRIEYSPIAGTRKRAADPQEDKRLAEELRADEKEVAEHIMLVDLGRNDVGRVAEYGSVHVDSLMGVEKYSHVQHLVTRIHATLRKGFTSWDALASCFPAGTVSGAPKIRAMQIIDELEPNARGVYAGAVLYADYAGNLDSCITIRTIRLRDGIAHVQAGAGIVADSHPASEYEETINKAKALINALALAEQA